MLSSIRRLISKLRAPATFELTTSYGLLQEFGLVKLPKGRGRPSDFTELRLERARRSIGDYPTGSGR